jgi:peptidoglycan/LPS O-acetylase OafA/YrhL
MSLPKTHDTQQKTEPGTRHLVRTTVADHAGLALIIGGLLWVATYLAQILIGLRLGAEVYADPDPDFSASWLILLWPVTFFGATLFLSVGVLGVAARIGKRGRTLAVLGAVVATAGVAASLVNLVLLTGITGEPTASDDLGFLGVVGVLGGSVLVGSAPLRGRVLRRPVRLTLALLPFAFIPAIIATIPLETVAPDYAVADLPFPVVGLVLAAVGLALRSDRHAATS